MRKALVLGTTAAAVLGLGAVSAPAQAACAVGDLTCTNVAVVVAAGTLSLVASPVAVGGAPLGTPAIAGTSVPTVLESADLALTTVTDTRTTSSGWSVTGHVSDFATITGVTIPAVGHARLGVPSAALAVLGTITSQTRNGTAIAVDSSANAPLMTVALTGVNTVTYIPHLDLDVNGAATGAYTGTLTQSVS